MKYVTFIPPQITTFETSGELKVLAKGHHTPERYNLIGKLHYIMKIDHDDVIC